MNSPLQAMSTRISLSIRLRFKACRHELHPLGMMNGAETNKNGHVVSAQRCVTGSVGGAQRSLRFHVI